MALILSLAGWIPSKLTVKPKRSTRSTPRKQFSRLTFRPVESKHKSTDHRQAANSSSVGAGISTSLKNEVTPGTPLRRESIKFRKVPGATFTPKL